MSAAPATLTRVDERTATLRDGTRIGFRLATPADRPALVRGFERLSPRSRYLRFFQAANRLSPRLLDLLSTVDETNRVAVIAYLLDEPDELIGVVRFTRLDDSSVADVALTVIDDWHGQGVGRATYEAARSYAMDQGIVTFTASVLTENMPMRQFFLRRGATVKSDPTDRTILDFRLDLTSI